MKQNKRTDLVFLLDRSGSMQGLEGDTIGGYNAMLAKQKETEGEVFVTTLLFDDRHELLCDRVPLQKAAPMTERDYTVRGCTALLDAMGMAIQQIGMAREPADQVIFVITTDGLENASREYTYNKVKALVEAKKALGWEFLFFGANMDAIAAAGRFGIGADRAVNYCPDGAGTRLNYQVASEAVSQLRAGRPMGAGWKAAVERDFLHRKPKRR